MYDHYNMIYKRKSMRKFNEDLTVSKETLVELERMIAALVPLDPSISTKIKLVDREETTAKRGSHCLLFYSERKPHYLLNAGYLLEQIDLFLTSRNIGVCWYALAKPLDTESEDLDYVILLAFGQSEDKAFRTSTKAFKRKPLDFIWEGNLDQTIGQVVRLTPSACNTQPWRIKSTENVLTVYRATDIKSFIPASKLPYYNSIDMGICLYFLESALHHHDHAFERQLFTEANEDNSLIPIARYNLS